MAAKTLAQVALEDMRIPGRPTPYGESYAVNQVRPAGRRANGNLSTQWIRALLVQGRYPTAEGFTTANPDYALEIAWNDPAVISDLAARSWGEILIWNHIYCTEEWGTQHAPGWINNSRAMWFGFETWLRSKATGQWSRLVYSDSWGGHPIAPDFTVEDFGGTWRDLRTESNGYQSVRLMYDNNAPYAGLGYNYWAFHGYAGGVQAFNASDVADVFVCARVSLVQHNASLLDDREFTRYAVSLGADYYPSPRTYIYPSVGVSRHKLLRARWPEWQFLVMHTMTEAQLASVGIPPALAGLVEGWDEGGTAPPSTTPAGPAPSKGRWLDTYTTSPRGRWVDISPASAVAPSWGAAPPLAAVIGVAFSYTPPLAAGAPAPTYSKVSGASWASVNSTTGAVTGTPTGSPTTASVVVRATNASGTADITLQIEVTESPPAVSVTTASLPGGVQGVAYATALVATGVAPFAWAVTVGTLPAGLAVVGGTISGTPTGTGTSTFTVQVTDALGRTATRSLSIVVSAASGLPNITAALPDATVGTAYHQPIVTTGTAPITTTVASGALPPGLALLPGADRNKIRNPSGQGAVAGSPGTLPTNWIGSATLDGVSRSIIGTGTDTTTGLPYVDVRLSGTSSTGGTQIPLTFDSTSQVAAALGQAWIPSLHLAVVGGSTTGISALVIRHRFYNSGGTALTARDSSLLTGLSGTLARFVGSGFAATDATTASTMSMIALDYANSTAIDVTLRIAGVQLESLATANVLRNPSPTGAVAGAPGTLPTYWSMPTTTAGLSREVVGTGTESGSDYIDVRISGTSSSATSYTLEFDTVNAAAVGQNWTASANVRLVAGSLSNITTTFVGVNEHNAAGTYLTQTTASITPTASAQRWAVSRVLTSGTVAHARPVVGITFGSGVAINVTLRIALPSMQQGGAAAYSDPRYTYVSGTPTVAGGFGFTARATNTLGADDQDYYLMVRGATEAASVASPWARFTRP